MALKGQEKVRFDEFAIVLLGGIIFLGILLIAFNTPTEFPPKVSPASLRFELSPGDSQTFSINITGRISSSNITTSGVVGDWINVPQTNLGVLTQNTLITMTLNVPATATSGTHTGKIIVSGAGGKFEVDVTVFVTAIKKLTSRSLTVGDFKVRFLNEDRILDSVDNANTARSYFGEKKINLIGILEEEDIPLAKSAVARFVVEDTNNLGPIIVTQNGVDVFKQQVGPGEVVVPLNVSDMKRSNVVSIRSDTPGIFFWAENVYNIRNAEFEVSLEGSAPKTFNFTLLPEEINKFDHFQLTFLAKGPATPSTPLRITINDQAAYLAVPSPTVFSQNFARDLLGRTLVIGEINSIMFSFDQHSAYEIEDAILTIFTRA